MSSSSIRAMLTQAERPSANTGGGNPSVPAPRRANSSHTFASSSSSASASGGGGGKLSSSLNMSSNNSHNNISISSYSKNTGGGTSTSSGTSYYSSSSSSPSRSSSLRRPPLTGSSGSNSSISINNSGVGGGQPLSLPRMPSFSNQSLHASLNNSSFNPTTTSTTISTPKHSTGNNNTISNHSSISRSANNYSFISIVTNDSFNNNASIITNNSVLGGGSGGGATTATATTTTPNTTTATATGITTASSSLNTTANSTPKDGAGDSHTPPITPTANRSSSTSTNGAASKPPMTPTSSSSSSAAPLRGRDKAVPNTDDDPSMTMSLSALSLSASAVPLNHTTYSPQPEARHLRTVQQRKKNNSPFDASLYVPMLAPPIPRNKGKVLLCLDLDETFVHSSFAPAGKYDARVTLESGTERAFAYVALRPHLRTFIAAIAPLFELAVFTASQSGYADKVMSVVDPDGALGPLRLYREHCALVNGNRVKDLSLLGRPLDRVALLDNSPVAYLFQPRNALPITSWFDDPADSELLRLIPLLRRLAASASVYDVLDVHNALLLDPAYAAAQADADDAPADLPPVRGRRPSPILVDGAKA